MVGEDMNIEFSYKDGILDITKCPNVFDKKCYLYIDNGLKNNLKNLSIVEEICFPDNVEVIDDDLFSSHLFLRKVKLPKNLKKLGNSAFDRCSLEELDLPEGLKEIGDFCFGSNYFKTVNIPSGVDRIGRFAFYECGELSDVRIGEGLESLSKGCFMYCVNLKRISLPESLRCIEDSVFHRTRLKSVEIPDRVNFIGKNAFEGCEHLESIKLPSCIKKLNSGVFSRCYMLSKVEIPEGIQFIDTFAFDECKKLRGIKLPHSLKQIGKSVFSNCGLEDIVIPEGVEVIDSEAFFNCWGLDKVILPHSLVEVGSTVFYNSSIKSLEFHDGISKVGECAFSNMNELSDLTFNNEFVMDHRTFSNSLKKLKNVTFKDSNRNIVFDVDDESFFPSKSGPVVVNGDKVNFYVDKKIVSCHIKELFKGANSVNALIDKIDCYDIYARLYKWNLCNKFLPHYVVVDNMPMEDIHLFYENKNYKKWADILRSTNIQADENRATLFKLCYALGVFQESGKKRDEAVDYIKEYILSNLDENEIHARFDGLDLRNRFDPMWAEFFMKYYKDNPDFMTESYIDLIAASYNRFKDVRECYPNKVVNTNREADILLPEHVKSAITTVSYSNVNEDGRELSMRVGKYGYSSRQFEDLQEWFLDGKNIERKDLKLFISKDIVDSDIITYELLEKDNPLGAVLGNITNCCQVIGGAGESCVKYGMCKPNSRFMMFSINKNIIGQSWVWYDEKTGVVCLDNIEVPTKYLYKIGHSKELQKSFINCLNRMANNFINEMKNCGLNVNKVTVGKGFNDIQDILDENFLIDESPSFLNDYYDYTDSKIQYIIKKK